MLHALAIAPGCHAAKPANIAITTNTTAGMAGTTVAGIARISSGWIPDAIITASEPARIHIVDGEAFKVRPIDRLTAPVDESRHADRIRSSRKLTARPGTLDANAELVRSKSSFMAVTREDLRSCR